MLIQIILIVCVVVVALLLTRSTAGARHLAIRRLLLMLFIVAAVFAILFPKALSNVARFVGVGRGTDLLLYALVIAFLSFVATSYRRMAGLNRKITQLTRELALFESREAQRDAGQAASSNAPPAPTATGSDGVVAPEGTDGQQGQGKDAAEGATTSNV